MHVMDNTINLNNNKNTYGIWPFLLFLITIKMFFNILNWYRIKYFLDILISPNMHPKLIFGELYLENLTLYYHIYGCLPYWGQFNHHVKGIRREITFSTSVWLQKFCYWFWDRINDELSVGKSTLLPEGTCVIQGISFGTYICWLLAVSAILMYWFIYLYRHIDKFVKHQSRNYFSNMVWCLKTTRDFLKLICPSSMTPHGLTRR